ncbi:hypothetical protein Q8A73_015550 [Channa argus]|nr:hypothetical protein Q8A73_015550 [Channa argus]
MFSMSMFDSPHRRHTSTRCTLSRRRMALAPLILLWAQPRRCLFDVPRASFAHIESDVTPDKSQRSSTTSFSKGLFAKILVAYGHTTLNTPDLVRSRKLSRGCCGRDVVTSLDSLQFAYPPQLGVEDALIHLLPRIYTNLDKPGGLSGSLMDSFVNWCENNHVQLNVSKTKKLMVDYRKSWTPVDPLFIRGEAVEAMFPLSCPPNDAIHVRISSVTPSLTGCDSVLMRRTDGLAKRSEDTLMMLSAAYVDP